MKKTYDINEKKIFILQFDKDDAKNNEKLIKKKN